MPGLRLRRALAGRRQDLPPELRDAWSAPLPRPRSTVDTLRFLVCDAEMSGLDPARDELLSLGWVVVEGRELVLASARHLLLLSEGSVGQSAAVHGLRDCELRDGTAPQAALLELLAASRGCVLVFHHAALDMAFLDAVARRLWGVPLLLPRIDTLRIEERALRRAHQPIAKGALRLAECRRRHGLAGHRGHSALTDAIATAELLLAQFAVRGPGLRLRDLQA